MIHETDPKCDWCKQPASNPGHNDRGERCPCRCHPAPIMDLELPGMWERADFEGGLDEVRR